MSPATALFAAAFVLGAVTMFAVLFVLFVLSIWAAMRADKDWRRDSRGGRG